MPQNHAAKVRVPEGSDGNMLDAGDSITPFRLPNLEGGTWTESNLQGHHCVLFFFSSW